MRAKKSQKETSREGLCAAKESRAGDLTVDRGLESYAKRKSGRIGLFGEILNAKGRREEVRTTKRGGERRELVSSLKQHPGHRAR